MESPPPPEGTEPSPHPERGSPGAASRPQKDSDPLAEAEMVSSAEAGARSPSASAPTSAKGKRSQIVSWALWDWGSASFNAVIITFVFTPYLTGGVASSEEAGSSALGWAMAAAGFIIAFVAPAAGTRADAGGRHRMWLGVHTGLVVLAMLGLFFVRDSPEYLWLGLLLIALGSVFFEFAEVSYNGIMVRITDDSNVGKVSGFGWGMGYVGGLVLLVILLFTVIQPEVGLFGASDAEGLRYRIVAVIAAAWFAIFAIPVLITAPGVQTTGTSQGNPLRAFAHDYAVLVRRLVRMWKEEHQTLRFFIASAVFRDGLAAIFSFAGVLAAGSYGFTPSEVIYLGVAANISAGIGSVLAGWLDDRVGPKPVIVAGLVIILLGGVPILLSDAPAVFWVCALVLSFCVGPVQASSRSFLARITPPERAGENFGLYATTGRAVSFLGPAMFALAITVLGFQRAGTLGILIVLLFGLCLILLVKPEAPRLSVRP